jgi:phospholipase C
VAWVIPDLKWADYPLVIDDYGPSWVGDLVNAIGSSRAWDSTAIVILWDDWGGLYDNVPPPQLDYVGLGIRVPCIIVSPYARTGVSHTQYEYGSILKFVEEAFGLRSLHSTDDRANSLVDSFDFGQQPRKYKPIKTRYAPSFFLGQPQSMRPPDND